MLADDDTGREDGKMDGKRERNAVIKGGYDTTTSNLEEGSFTHCHSFPTGLFVVFFILHLLPYFIITVITLVWSVMV